MRPAPASSPPAAAAATSSPSPTARPATIVLSTGTKLLFMGEDGTTLSIADDRLQPADPYAAAAGLVWSIGDDNHLDTIDMLGARTDLGALAGFGPGDTATGLVVSTDGQHWAWGLCSACVNRNGRERVYIGGVGASPRLALDEQVSSNSEELVPLAWTRLGLFVERVKTSFGGCCYFNPETGHVDTLLVDPSTLQVTQTTGCPTAFASPAGAFTCVAGKTIVVHLPDGTTRTVMPANPVVDAGWGHVDDVGNRAVFGVAHARGGPGANCPCTLDVEAADLATGAVTKLADQMLFDGLLPDGAIVVRSAPMVPDQGPHTEWIISPAGGQVRLSSDDGALYVGAF